MNPFIVPIPVMNLLLLLIPVAIVTWIHFRWSAQAGSVLYATIRMVSQLVIIGFLLSYIFANKNALVVSAILIFMLMAASWIALRALKPQRVQLYPRAFTAIFLGAGSTLIFIVIGVIRLDPWYEPRYLIPLAGMIFANAMNSVSLAAERFESEYKKESSYLEARHAAYRASLLPQMNAMFAVGLVSLPGMMTGQILAGVSPLVAIRYQIMVMAMLLAASGISSAIYLRFMKPR